MNTIIANNQQDFIDQINSLADAKRSINQQSTDLKERIESTAESFDIDKAVVNAAITAVLKDDAEGKIDGLTSIVDVSTLFKRG